MGSEQSRDRFFANAFDLRLVLCVLCTLTLRRGRMETMVIVARGEEGV